VRTWREIERVMRVNILPVFRHKLITEVRRADIFRLLDAMMDRRAPIAANETLSVFKRWLNWAVERGYLEASPAAMIRPPAPKRQRDRVLETDELAEVWSAAGKMPYPYGPFLRVLILTAQRRGEVARMRWEDVNLSKKLWTLSAAQTKAGRIHDVPLSPAVVDILSALPRFPGPYVFAARGEAKALNSFSRCKTMLEAAIASQRRLRRLEPLELAAFTIHDFRRTATSWMAKENVAPHVLNALLNHSPGTIQGVTAIYNRFRYLDERRAALDIWARHVAALGKGRRSATA
jgi:integrase